MKLTYPRREARQMLADVGAPQLPKDMPDWVLPDNKEIFFFQILNAAEHLDVDPQEVEAIMQRQTLAERLKEGIEESVKILIADIAELMDDVRKGEFYQLIRGAARKYFTPKPAAQVEPIRITTNNGLQGYKKPVDIYELFKNFQGDEETRGTTTKQLATTVHQKETGRTLKREITRNTAFTSKLKNEKNIEDFVLQQTIAKKYMSREQQITNYIIKF